MKHVVFKGLSPIPDVLPGGKPVKSEPGDKPSGGSSQNKKRS